MKSVKLKGKFRLLTVVGSTFLSIKFYNILVKKNQPFFQTQWAFLKFVMSIFPRLQLYQRYQISGYITKKIFFLQNNHRQGEKVMRGKVFPSSRTISICMWMFTSDAPWTFQFTSSGSGATLVSVPSSWESFLRGSQLECRKQIHERRAPAVKLSRKETRWNESHDTTRSPCQSIHAKSISH